MSACKPCPLPSKLQWPQRLQIWLRGSRPTWFRTSCRVRFCRREPAPPCALRISADISLDDDRVLVRVFSSGDIKYAAIQEFGGHTPAHDIVPNKARALAFTVGGRMVFAKVVHHPGSTIPQRSYLRSSLADMENQIVLELKAAAVGALTA